MRRREFITVFGGAAVTWPLAARIAWSGKLPVIGLIALGTAEGFRPLRELMVQRFRELGWTEGRDVVLEWRFEEGRIERAAEAAAEFARMGVDVIVVGGDSEALATRRATVTIPIVAYSIGDPVGHGLAESLAHPGGNVTGISLALTETAGKRLELLRDAVPGLKRVAVFGSLANPLVASERNAVMAAARSVGLDTITSGFRVSEDIAPAIASLKGAAQAIYVCTDPSLLVHLVEVNAAALAAGLPIMHLTRYSTVGGGFISYGPNIPELYRRAVALVDKILRGAKPADIPFEQPIKWELAINLKTAKALGLTVPETFLTRADEVIE
jgi:putative ABC transport system substrate-binding protein